MQLHTQNTSLSNTLLTSSLSHRKNQTHEFSMRKVLTRIKNYQCGWDKQTAARGKGFGSRGTGMDSRAKGFDRQAIRKGKTAANLTSVLDNVS